MATIKIPYGGNTYPLFMQGNKITTPSIVVAGQGYIPLYQGGNIGDPILYGGVHILKKAPMKVAGNGTWYRPTWYHEQIGAASCIVYYKAAFVQETKSQNDRYWVTTDQYGNGYWHDNWQTYYLRHTYAQIYIGSFAIASAHNDLRIVLTSLTVGGVNVNNTWGNTEVRSTSWSKPAPNYPTYNKSATAVGTYAIYLGNILLKTGNCSVSFNVPINNANQQNTARLTLNI